jgi:hypothetical protein
MTRFVVLCRISIFRNVPTAGIGLAQKFLKGFRQLPVLFRQTGLNRLKIQVQFAFLKGFRQLSYLFRQTDSGFHKLLFICLKIKIKKTLSFYQTERF